MYWKYFRAALLFELTPYPMISRPSTFEPDLQNNRTRAETCVVVVFPGQGHFLAVQLCLFICFCWCRRSAGCRQLSGSSFIRVKFCGKEFVRVACASCIFLVLSMFFSDWLNPVTSQKTICPQNKSRWVNVTWMKIQLPWLQRFWAWRHRQTSVILCMSFLAKLNFR